MPILLFVWPTGGSALVPQGHIAHLRRQHSHCPVVTWSSLALGWKISLLLRRIPLPLIFAIGRTTILTLLTVRAGLPVRYSGLLLVWRRRYWGPVLRTERRLLLLMGRAIIWSLVTWLAVRVVARHDGCAFLSPVIKDVTWPQVVPSES